jgi:hypothetical protein
MIENTEVVLAPLQITHVPQTAPRPPVGSLTGEDDRIINASDSLLSRVWR